MDDDFYSAFSSKQKTSWSLQIMSFFTEDEDMYCIHLIPDPKMNQGRETSHSDTLTLFYLHCSEAGEEKSFLHYASHQCPSIIQDSAPKTAADQQPCLATCFDRTVLQMLNVETTSPS